jgi:hypothetical protein
MQSRLTRVVAAGVLSIFMSTSLALAGSVTQPGETVGIPTGAPLPEGVYFENTADWGCRNTNPTSCQHHDLRSRFGVRVVKISGSGRTPNDPFDSLRRPCETQNGFFWGAL